MARLAGHDRSHLLLLLLLLLLPEAVDDHEGLDNPVRFVEAFVDELDLAGAGFARVVPKTTGWPGYDPADLLKPHICGTLNRVRSSRRLEAETHRDVEAIWLLRGLKPDFRTVADFRRDSRAAFRPVFRAPVFRAPVFRALVVLCRQPDLSGRELLVVDGTRDPRPSTTRTAPSRGRR